MKYSKIENFLSESRRDTLFNNIIDINKKGLFNRESVENERKSDIFRANDMGSYSYIFSNTKFFYSLYESLNKVCQTFDYTVNFSAIRTEIYVESMNNDSFYNVYKTANTNSRRKLCFRYYLNKEPKSFKGGNFVIYGDSRPFKEPSAYREANHEPKNNSIIFLPANYWVECSRIECESEKFEDGQLCINGWITDGLYKSDMSDK